MHCPVCGSDGKIEHLDIEIRNCLNCKFMWNTTFTPALLLDMAIAHTRARSINKERRKPRARCRFNENSNRQCLLDDPHTGGHNLPCIEASAHAPHAKASLDPDGNLYQCSGSRFDRT